MNDADLVAALRAKEPGGLALLFDSHGERLFRYCWFMLRSRDLAQMALRDSLIAAQANATLADPERLNSWLYAIARTQCRRRRPVPPAQADEPPPLRSQLGADPRLMAWYAVTGIAADEMEALELACRHDVELDQVLGLTQAGTAALLDKAQRNLERALGAEILINHGGHACPGRAQVLRGWSGTVTPGLRERVLRHAAKCEVCRPSLPHNVSAARVFAQLPVMALPIEARQRVLGLSAADPALPDREPQARLLVCPPRAMPARAVPSQPAPSQPVPSQPVPSQPAPSEPVPSDAEPPPLPARNRRPVVAAAALTAAGVLTAAAVVAAVMIAGPGSGGPGGVGGAGGRAQGPAVAAGGNGAFAPHRPDWAPPGVVPVVKRRRGAIEPVPLIRPPGKDSGIAMITEVAQPPPPPAGRRQQNAPANPGQPAAGYMVVSPDGLYLGPARQGQLVIGAEDGPVTWTASTDSWQIELSSSGGTLQDGQASTLAVTVTAPAGPRGSGNATVYITQVGGPTQVVDVVWGDQGGGRWPYPGPSPLPTPAPSSALSQPPGAPDPPGPPGPPEPPPYIDPHAPAYPPNGHRIHDWF